MKIELAKTAGYCYGVKRAIDLAQDIAQKEGTVYTLGYLIHNDYVINELSQKGIIPKDTIEEIPDGSVVLIRAHGIGEHLFNELIKKNCKCYDATCPNVSKIHKIVKEEYENGRKIIIIGKKNHPEIIGIEGWCDDSIVLEDEEEVENWFKNNEKYKNLPISIVFQTTTNKNLHLSILNFIKRSCTNVKFFDTICGATVNRQNEAQRLAHDSDLMIVIGDKKSSNTKRLFEICCGSCDDVIQIENANNIDLDTMRKYNNIGITAGTSTPEWIIEEVINKMSDQVEIHDGESFAELLEGSLKTLNTGDRVTGIITKISPTEIDVDLGVKQASYIPVNELSNDPDYIPEEHIKVGDSIETFVIRVNDVEGVIMPF